MSMNRKKQRFPEPIRVCGHLHTSCSLLVTAANRLEQFCQRPCLNQSQVLVEMDGAVRRGAKEPAEACRDGQPEDSVRY